jgi:hypothetical protein
MPWRGDLWEPPEWTLGVGVAEWAEAYLRVPSGPDYGSPLRLSGWQMRALADFYALDEAGRFLYRRGQIRLSKGQGKSPWAAVVALAELCGPSTFDGWDALGEPVGRAPAAPLVQICAVSEDQAANTYGALHSMLAESPLLDEARIDLGMTRTILRGRPGRIDVVTASAPSREGQPISFAVCDEVHIWAKSNGGRKLYNAIRRNATKMGGRILSTTNAYDPGAESVAELVEASAATTPGTMLYGPQYEAHNVELGNRESLLEGLRRVYRHAPWVDVERVAADCMDPDTPAEDVVRFFLNVNAASDSVLCESPAVSGDELEPGAPIAVGFDGSRTSDATAVVAVHMETGTAYLLGYWERPWATPRAARWEVPRHEVAAVVESLFGRYTVARMKADPAYWQEELAGWQRRYGRDVVDRMPVWQTAVVDRAVEAAQTALAAGTFKIAALGDELDEVLRAHLARCHVTRRHAGSRVLRTLTKPDDGGRIDAAAAAVYAWQARLEAQSKGWEKRPVADPFFAVW